MLNVSAWVWMVTVLLPNALAWMVTVLLVGPPLLFGLIILAGGLLGLTGALLPSPSGQLRAAPEARGASVRPIRRIAPPIRRWPGTDTDNRQTARRATHAS